MYNYGKHEANSLIPQDCKLEQDENTGWVFSTPSK